MTTFYNPRKVRELASSGDPFWKGAAWILDQQDAARIDTTDYDSEWRRDSGTRDAAVLASLDALVGPVDSSPIEEVRERLNARSLGLPYPSRLDIDGR